MSRNPGISRRQLLQSAGAAAGAARLRGAQVSAGAGRRVSVRVDERGAVRVTTATLEATSASAADIVKPTPAVKRALESAR